MAKCPKCGGSLHYNEVDYEHGFWTCKTHGFVDNGDN